MKLTQRALCDKKKTTVLRNGDYLWRDALGIPLFKWFDIGNPERLYTTIPESRISRRDSYWVKWVDVERKLVFIVPSHGCIGCAYSFNEWYWSFVAPPLPLV